MFGPQETNKWGAFVWGVDNWAYSQFDLPVTLDKVVANSIGSTSVIVTLLDIGVMIGNEMFLTGNMYDETVTDQNGYYRAFGYSRNAENRPLTGYNSLSDITTSYTLTVDPGTSYTQIN